MTIEIRPDPSRPHGGYARLMADGLDPSGGTITVDVFDNYAEQYLGKAGWQPTQVAFGPYEVEDFDGRTGVVVGPEIVNGIEEYKSVRLTVGPVSDTVVWPDDVAPAFGAAPLGGIVNPAAAKGPEEPALAGPRITEPDPAEAGPVDPPPPIETTDPVEETPVEPKHAGRKTGLLAGAGVLVFAVAAGIAWFLLQGDRPEPGPEPVAAAPVAPTAPPSDPCADDALSGLGDQPFANTLQTLRGCGSAASADTALALLEDAAERDDPAALLLFGTVYDGEVTEDGIEDQTGLTFGDEPARAAEYYARAAAAGSSEANDRLASLCPRLQQIGDTLSQSAFEDFCGS